MISAVLSSQRLATLPAWLAQQRWYGGKQAPIAGIMLVDAVELGGGAGLALVEVSAPPAAPRRYQLVVTSGEWDGLGLAPVRRRFLELLAGNAALEGRHGRFCFESSARLAPLDSSRPLGAEQSNTSILYSDAAANPRWLLKLYRRAQAGEQPDVEVPGALRRQGLFLNVPCVAARVVYRTAVGDEFTLAGLSQFVPNQGDGWEYSLSRLRAGAGSALLEDLARLGQRTAELHLALAAVPGPAFAPEAATAADLTAWRERARAPLQAEELQPYARQLAPWRARLGEGLAGLDSLRGLARIRLHGDYHLGQVLRTRDDFYIFDFEGEPARPLAQRRHKGSVLQDVAGMLRSLSYAAHSSGQSEWESAARPAFLTAYRAALAASTQALVPAGDADFAAALQFFECEKAVYELGYELAHRPAWATVPLRGLAGLLAPRAPSG